MNYKKNKEENNVEEEDGENVEEVSQENKIFNSVNRKTIEEASKLELSILNLSTERVKDMVKNKGNKNKNDETSYLDESLKSLKGPHYSKRSDESLIMLLDNLNNQMDVKEKDRSKKNISKVSNTGNNFSTRNQTKYNEDNKDNNNLYQNIKNQPTENLITNSQSPKLISTITRQNKITNYDPNLNPMPNIHNSNIKNSNSIINNSNLLSSLKKFKSKSPPKNKILLNALKKNLLKPNGISSIKDNMKSNIIHKIVDDIKNTKNSFT